MADKQMDKNRTLKVETTGRPFYFSRLYEPDAEIGTHLFELWSFAKHLAELPLTPPLFGGLKDELIRRSIHGTAAIEGNPFSEDEVGEVLIRAEEGNEPNRSEKEIWNLKAAYLTMEENCRDRPPTIINITESLIRSIHRVVVAGVDEGYNIPGYYRNHSIEVGDKGHGGIYRPPKALADVKKLMAEFTVWINSQEVAGLGPYLRAALAHYHLVLIHPFSDGNGRVARLIEAYILMAGGVPFLPYELSNWYYRHLDDYFRAIAETQKDKRHRVTGFVKFALQGMAESAKLIWDRVRSFLWLAVWRDYLAALRDSRAITQRQYDLLRILTETDRDKALVTETLFTDYLFAPLYRKVSRRTARRDLVKLAQRGLLRQDEEGRFKINDDHLNWAKVGRIPGGASEPDQPVLFPDL